jgi:hypothetical protein
LASKQIHDVAVTEFPDERRSGETDQLLGMGNGRNELIQIPVSADELLTIATSNDQDNEIPRGLLEQEVARSNAAAAMKTDPDVPDELV